jgi:acyl-CoA reductase-like NAD-dependent aldehyde dehydrogenase
VSCSYKVADEFAKKFAEKAKSLPVGDRRKPESVVLGSVCGGHETTLMPATVLDHVTKASGIGRFGGKAGVAEFTELGWITLCKLRLGSILFSRYGEGIAFLKRQPLVQIFIDISQVDDG